MIACPYCGAQLGPAESALGCLTCRGGGDGSNQDDIVAVLEHSDIPLPHWDIKRLLDKNRGYPVHNGSLLVWLANDPRACWGGRGIYGLYRHGLLPGVRDLGTAGAIFLHVTGRALHYSQLWFVMKYAGYRSEELSIYYALRRAEEQGLVQRAWGGEWRRPPHEQLPDTRLKRLLGARGRDFELVLERTERQLQQALLERHRRLRGAHES
jgi:hypothetical protein